MKTTDKSSEPHHLGPVALLLGLGVLLGLLSRRTPPANPVPARSPAA